MEQIGVQIVNSINYNKITQSTQSLGCQTGSQTGSRAGSAFHKEEVCERFLLNRTFPNVAQMSFRIWTALSLNLAQNVFFFQVSVLLD